MTSLSGAAALKALAEALEADGDAAELRQAVALVPLLDSPTLAALAKQTIERTIFHRTVIRLGPAQVTAETPSTAGVEDYARRLARSHTERVCERARAIGAESAAASHPADYAPDEPRHFLCPSRVSKGEGESHPVYDVPRYLQAPGQGSVAFCDPCYRRLRCAVPDCDTMGAVRVDHRFVCLDHADRAASPAATPGTPAPEPAPRISPEVAEGSSGAPARNRGGRPGGQNDERNAEIYRLKQEGKSYQQVTIAINQQLTREGKRPLSRGHITKIVKAMEKQANKVY